MSKLIEAAEYYMTELLDMTRVCPKHKVITHTNTKFEAELENGITAIFHFHNGKALVDFYHIDTKYKTRNKQEWATITKIFDLLDCIVLQNHYITTITFKAAEDSLDIIGTSPYFKTECLNVIKNGEVGDDIIQKLIKGEDLYRHEFDELSVVMEYPKYDKHGILFGDKNFWVIESQRAKIYLKALRKNFPNITFEPSVKGNFFYIKADQRII